VEKKAQVHASRPMMNTIGLIELGYRDAKKPRDAIAAFMA